MNSGRQVPRTHGGPGGSTPPGPPRTRNYRTPAQLKVSFGAPSLASESAWSSQNAPAAGSTAATYSGPPGPAVPRVQEPSDSPGTFTQRYASTSGTPVFAVGRTP